MVRKGGGGVSGRAPIDRFREKYKIDRDTGCFVWTAALNSRGYGVFGFGGKGKVVLAHRWAYEHVGGKIIPPGLVIDHMCCNRRCVNHEHMQTVTNAENIRLGTSPSAQNGSATHCAHGHELSGDNVWTPSDGSRRRTCVACHRRLDQEYQERLRAKRIRPGD